MIVPEVTGYLATRAGLRPATRHSDRHILLQFARWLGDIDLDEITAEHIRRWLASQRRLAPGTVRNRYSVVRGWFRWLAVEQGIKDPFLTVDPPRVPRRAKRALSAGQVADLLAACPDVRARCVVLLGVQLGLRRAEIAGLQVGDVDLSGRTLLVKEGKGGHERVVPLTDDARRAVEAYLSVSPCPAGPLLRGDRYPAQGVTAAWVGRLVTRVAWDAGIKARKYDGVSTHALRHTAASDVYASSRDVLAVRDLLGHVSLANTELYLRGLDMDRLRRAAEGRHYG